MKIYKKTLLKSLGAFLMIAMIFGGILASLGGKAQAATPINIAYAAGDNATINNGQPVYNVTAYANVQTTITSVKPTRSGCNFLGWTTTKNSGRIDYRSGDRVTFKKGTTLWPVWNANIAYAADGGKFGNGAVVMNVSVTLGKAMTVPSALPSKTGYVCLGWSATKGSGTVQYRPGATITYNAPTTIWPVWRKLHEIFVWDSILDRVVDHAEGFIHGEDYDMYDYFTKNTKAYCATCGKQVNATYIYRYGLQNPSGPNMHLFRCSESFTVTRYLEKSCGHN